MPFESKVRGLARAGRDRPDSFISLMLDQYRGSETILLVDDEPVVLTLTRSILSRCGYKVYDFSDPVKALEKNSDLPIDLVLTDIVMPNLSGPDMVKKIKTARPGIPCIFMSGYDVHQIAEKGLNAECNYLRKPFTPEGLVKKVRFTLEEKAGDSEDGC